MAYQDTENKIIGNLLRKPLESKSMHQLAKESRLSYITVHKIVPTLIKRKIVHSETKGKAHQISIDLEQAPLEKLSSAMLYEKEHFLKKHPSLLILSTEFEEALAEQFYILLLFGSYAQEKERKNSDMDLLFIIPESEKKEEYSAKINKVLKLHPQLPIDCKIVSTLDFIEMLNQKYTLGRSVFREGMVLFGTEQYYAMVKEYARTKGY